MATEQDLDNGREDSDGETTEQRAEERYAGMMALWTRIRGCRRNNGEGLMRRLKWEHGGEGRGAVCKRGWRGNRDRMARRGRGWFELTYAARGGW